MSTKTGRAPTASTTDAVAPNVRSGTRTSSPGPTPRLRRARWSAPVPLEVAMQGVLNRSEKAFSNSPSNLPACVTYPSSMHWLRYFLSLPLRSGFARGIKQPLQLFFVLLPSLIQPDIELFFSVGGRPLQIPFGLLQGVVGFSQWAHRGLNKCLHVSPLLISSGVHCV